MQRLGAWCARVGQSYLPHPLTLACLLSVGVLLAGMWWPDTALASLGFVDRGHVLCTMWAGGLWSTGFLAFALQMCVVLLTGFGLARAPVVQRALRRVAGLASTNRGAVVVIALASCVGCWINWGLGLVGAGLLAVELRTQLGRRGIHAQTSLLVAAAYSGMMIWHGGLSGSAPLKAAQGVTFIRSTGAANSTTIGLQQTVLSLMNGVTTCVVACLTIGLLYWMARPDDCSAVEVTPAEPVDPDRPSPTFAGRLDGSRIVPCVVSTVCAIALVGDIRAEGWAAVDINFVNTTFLALGLTLHGSLLSYVAAVAQGGQAVVGIIIQFPIYAGILAVMNGAGLTARLTEWATVGATSATALGLSEESAFALACFGSAALVNLMVPSGGGQWIVQGPIMLAGADQLGAPLGATVMAISYGDQWTNMIQPFWAIPLMGMTRVDVRSFMGYCAVLMLASGPVFACGLLLLGQ